MSNKNLLVLGGRSDIGQATAREFAAKGFNLILASRPPSTTDEPLRLLCDEYGVSLELLEFDIADFEAHRKFIENLNVLPDVVLCAVGHLGVQELEEHDIALVRLGFNANLLGPISILSLFADAFEKRGSGSIIGISSVAGIRGRATNYFYGSAKAGFSCYLSGLRARLHAKGVTVISVMPGFVQTKMIKNIKTPRLLTTTSEHVGEMIYGAYYKGTEVIYVRKVWKLISIIISLLPHFVFNRLKF